MAAGKPVEGCIRLRAFHEGGQVNIEISDDGKGINPVKIKAIALERGLITSDQAAHMSERECTHLLFLPGFSTAEKVTNVSGRGVGMDVVKTNIEKIGGAIDIQSEVGKGTIMKIRIPLTLAIIPALIVTSGNDRYAIPQVSLLELVRLDGENARHGIERIHGCPVYRLRGNLLPLVYLNNELRVESSHDSRDADAVHIVVLQADDRQFGLVVESINDTEEIVVKPLSKMLKSIAVFAGATIMGDGRVALILDVMGIAQKSGVISRSNDRGRAEAESKAVDRNAQKQTYLLLGMGAQRRLAVPLSLVARLEEIDSRTIEFSDTQEVVQYRGQILPLVRLNDFLAGGGERGEGSLNVVVYTENGKSVGLVVDRIIDIVEDLVDVRHVVNRDGIIGTSIIQQQVTDLLDVGALIRSSVPSFVDHHSAV
jgi:two-component system chemotaxis sensor kinase CheA